MQTITTSPAPDAPAQHLLSRASGAAHSLLQRARQRAQAEQLPFSGSVTPLEAWQLITDGAARLVDVRSAEECKFVGHVAQAINIPWATGLSLNRNVRFVKELETKGGGKNAILLLLCRSGKRSTEAASAATQAGFTSVFNVLEGFEGDLNRLHQRGSEGGWRYWNLPWEQD